MPLTSKAPERRLMRIRGRARANSERSRPASSWASRASRAATEQVEASGDVGNGAERRRSRRAALMSEVLIRRVGGFNLTLQMRDISTGGCKVDLVDPYEVGDPAITRLPQLEPLGSRICWVNGAAAGVQFLTTLHPAVFSALLERLGDPEAT